MTLKDRLDAYRDAINDVWEFYENGAAADGERMDKQLAARADLESHFADLEKCKRFAQKIFEIAGWPEGGDIDGFELQDAAEKCGLLVATTPTEPCGESCNCLENNYRESFAQGIVTCYRKTEVLRSAK